MDSHFNQITTVVELISDTDDYRLKQGQKLLNRVKDIKECQASLVRESDVPDNVKTGLEAAFIPGLVQVLANPQVFIALIGLLKEALKGKSSKIKVTVGNITIEVEARSEAELADKLDYILKTVKGHCNDEKISFGSRS